MKEAPGTVAEHLILGQLTAVHETGGHGLLRLRGADVYKRQLVKFAQNELQDMRYIFQSNPLISEASFYFENDGVYEMCIRDRPKQLAAYFGLDPG